MKILIDTQVLIWLINEDKQLGPQSSQVLYDSSNELKLSYFSIFEMTIKNSIGKLDYDSSVIGDLPKIGIELLLPNESTLDGYTIFNPENIDPFDNAIIAVAINEDCLLMTSDSKILATTAKDLSLANAKN